MKTPEEIKKGLECCSRIDFCAKCPYKGECNWFRTPATDALALIQQLEAENRDLLEERELNDYLRDRVKQLEAELDNIRSSFSKQSVEVEEYKLELLRSVQKILKGLPCWIRAKDRLPDKNGKYLVHAHHWLEGVKPIIRYAQWVNGKWGKYDAYTIDHWMPLPEPPKEE